MAKKLLAARALTTGLLALGACTGNPGEPPPVDASIDTPPGRDCGIEPDASLVTGPVPCGVAPTEPAPVTPPAAAAAR